MENIGTIPDTADVVRVGDRFVSPTAAQLHIFGVLLGAHLGNVGHVSTADLQTLPEAVRECVTELVDAGIWWPAHGGYEIDREQAIRTMRESLDRLNDPARCVETGSAHVRGEDGTCVRCGAPPA